MEGRRKAGAGKDSRGFRVLAFVVLLAAGVFAALFVTRASADYADGYQTKQSLALEDAVKVWRKAGWQQDDFFSQIALGDLYSGDQSFADPVEAYVWYFMALRPDHRYRTDDAQADRTADGMRQGAFDNMRRIFNSLTVEQRMEARSRIVYILASRGSEGFIALGKLHREYSTGHRDRPWRPRQRHMLKCYYERESIFSRFWRLLAGGRERPPSCRIVRVPWGDDDGAPPNEVDAASSGDSEPSAIMRSNADALMYFDIAVNLGHPLAKDYTGSHQAAMSQVGDISGIVAEAAARARNWTPSFEYYPGATAGGVPHSDESLPSLAQRQALARVREIPFHAFEEALAFRGLLRGSRGFWHASPAAMAQAVRKFQSALNFEPTGFLFPSDAVRLIRMSAVDGDAVSQNRLGIMYAKGVGVPLNFPRAEKWFFLAAKQHYGEALYNLGVLYKVGPNGVMQDKDKAARLFAESALAGFNPARCELRELLSQAGDDRRNHGARR